MFNYILCGCCPSGMGADLGGGGMSKDILDTIIAAGVFLLLALVSGLGNHLIDGI